MRIVLWNVMSNMHGNGSNFIKTGLSKMTILLLQLLFRGEHRVKVFRSAIGFMFLLFVAFYPINASAATLNEAQLAVKKAESYGGSLKWQMSVERNNGIRDIDMKLYNDTKTYYQKAVTIVSSLKKSTAKTQLEARLSSNVKQQIDKAATYIDALKVGQSVEAKRLELKKRNDSLVMNHETVILYNNLSAEIKKLDRVVSRVYGKPNRDAFREKFVNPARLEQNRIIYPVSAFIELERAKQELAKNEVNVDYVLDRFILIDRFLEKIEQESIYLNIASNLHILEMELADMNTFDGPRVISVEVVEDAANTIRVLFKGGEADPVEEEYYEIEIPYEVGKNSVIGFEHGGYEYLVNIYWNEGQFGGLFAHVIELDSRIIE